MTNRDLLSVREVASELRVPIRTVYRLIRNHDLIAVKTGRSYRIYRFDLDVYIARIYWK
jgi:excisionase family DNA binding protein